MEKTIQEYERLRDVVHPKGTGIPELTATLVKRNGRICMYERFDPEDSMLAWEVFIVQYSEAEILKGNYSYPAREIYPRNESFGDTAWCFSVRENADRCYDRLILMG